MKNTSTLFAVAATDTPLVDAIPAVVVTKEIKIEKEKNLMKTGTKRRK